MNSMTDADKQINIATPMDTKADKSAPTSAPKQNKKAVLSQR